MKNLYSKQAVISLIGLIVSGLLYKWFTSGFFLALAILFLGSYLQCVYDLYKEKKTVRDTIEPGSINT